MKLHLPKALLTALITVAVAHPVSWAEGIGNSYDTKYSYTGTIYTFSGAVPGDGTVTSKVHVTTRNNPSNPTDWTMGTGTTTEDGSTTEWDAIYNGEYNTLRLTESKVYSFKFGSFTMAGLIVEADADGAAFQPGSSAVRDITIGQDGQTNTSYFGGSFTFNNKETTATPSVSTNAGSNMTLQGLVNWYIEDGKKVSLISRKAVINNGTWTVEGGSVEITNGLTTKSTIHSNSAITLSGGNLSFKAAALLDAVEGTDSYSEGENGYQSGDFYLVKGTGDSATVTSTAETALESASGKSYSVKAEDGSLIVTLDGEGGLYHVNTEVNYGGKDGNATIEAGTTTGILMSGGRLNLNQALAEGIAITTTNKAGSVINIGAGVTLDNSSVSSADGTATLAGVAATKTTAASIYNMGAMSIGNNNRTPNVSMGENWQGTVVFAAGTTLGSQYLDLNAFGVAGSTIQFDGATGYLGAARPAETNEDAATYEANIKLTGDGLLLNDGYGASEYSFNGDFSGGGKMEFSKALDKNGKGLIVTYKGDMSGWTGDLRHTNSYSTNSYTFAAANGKNTTIGNKVTVTNGTMNVNVTNTSAVKMSGEVTATGGRLKLTKTGDSKLTVNNLAANGGDVVLSGSGSNAIEITNLSVAADNTVTGTADVTVTGNLDANRTEGVALTGALTLKDGVTVDVADLLQADTYTYNLASATNGVTVGTYSVTGLGDAYSSYQGRVSAVDPNAAAGVAAASEGNSNTNLVLTLELVKLTVKGTNGYANGVLTLTTAEKATGAIFGESLAASVSDDIWAQITKDYTLDEEYSITFVGADGTTFDFDGDGTLTAPTITFMGETATDITGNGTIVGIFTIPEPTTATLSLLALAALAARRRRR